MTNSSLFGGSDYVQVLSSDIVLGNTANAHSQGQTLGNLAAGSHATQLEELVDKWFLGTDHPLGTADTGGTYSYSQVSGQLFVNGVSYTDVRQGMVGDCYFLSSLAEIALRNPNAITSMFIVNGDGTYTVRFYNGTTAQYVTVDQQLPTSGGNLIFDGMGASATNSTNVLWVALAEKAYVQMNECGWIRPSSWGGGQNVYTGISEGDMYMAHGSDHRSGDDGLRGDLQQFRIHDTGDSLCWRQIDLLGFQKALPSSAVIGDHAYSVLSVDAATQTVTMFNPWGINNSHDSGVITLSWAQIQANFDYFDQTA